MSALFSTKLKAQNMKFYDQKWQQVDSFDSKGLPKSALEVTDKIFEQAKKDKNSEQVIKSFIYKLKFKNVIEENAFEKLTHQLDSAAQKADFPDNAIMHTMLADMYWWYYQNNRWKFYNRTNTQGFKNDDMETWTLDFLVEKMIQQYKLSLQKTEDLQKIQLSKYQVLINYGTQPRELRPTLYDFLVHRAIDFYESPEITLTKPAEYFELREDYYFAETREFCSQAVISSDTLSLHYQAILLYQELLRFRLGQDKEIPALIDADLGRLDFAYSQSVNPKKDQLYFKSLTDLEKKYSENPYSAEISYRLAQYHSVLGAKYNPLDKETFKYQFEKKTAHDICINTISKFPKTFTASKCLQLQQQIEMHDISFTSEDVVPLSSKFALKINTTNINKVYIRVAKMDYGKYQKMTEKNYGQELYDKLLAGSGKIYDKIPDLPDDKDFNNHSVEFLTDGLPLGFYVIFISNNEKFTYEKGIASFSLLRISNISYFKQSQPDGSYKFFVVDRTTGAALPGVACQTWKQNYNYTLQKYVRQDGKRYVTGEDGSFVMETKNNYSDSWNIEFTKNDDFLPSENSTYIYKNSTSEYNQTKVFFFTDRAIYRPGQTIYFKGIALNTIGDKNTILPSYPVNVILYDVNRQKVSDLNLTTNEFGTFSGTFEIPQGLLNGNFQLYTSYGSLDISVEEYKRPKFEVTFLPFNGNYLLNDSVEISGKAISFSGASVTDAAVNFHITRSPQWYGWWYRYFNSPAVEIAHGKLTTDDNGNFKLKFKALPDESFEKSEFLAFNFSVKVDVTDLNGETQSNSSSVQVGFQALQLNIPFGGNYDKKSPDWADKDKSKIKIGTQNFNGEFIPAAGEIKIYKLKDIPATLRNRLWDRPDKHLYSKEDWYKNFSGNVFEDEDDYMKFDKDKQVFAGKFDTKTEPFLDITFLKDLEPGRYTVENTSKDAFGNPVSSKSFFTIINSEDKKMPYNASEFFCPILSQCEPGEKAKFLIGSSLQNIRVLYQIEHKNEIVSTQFITLNSEQKLIEIPIPEDYRGNFSVHFVFVKDNRWHYYNSVITVPYTNKMLDISFSTFRDKLQPGQKEEWQIKIKGDKAQKVAAEMLATLYDASLDQFRPNYWNFDIYQSYYTQRLWAAETFGTANSSILKLNFDDPYYPGSLYYDSFNWFGMYYYNYNRNYYYAEEDKEDGGISLSSRSSGKNKRMAKKDGDVFADEKSVDAPPPPPPITSDGTGEVPKIAPVSTGDFGGKDKDKLEQKLSEVKVRTNFNETAFFYPHLKTDEEGNVIISFTIPEALTKWKMMGFAVTKDLQYGFTQKELVTQKDLMVVPNEPRFFRENDKITFPVKISNISAKSLTGVVKLEFFDALTMNPISNIFVSGENQSKNFTVEAGKNMLVGWNLTIPEGISAVTYKVTAAAGDFSDGEQKPLPILSDRMLVTESMPLPIRGKGTKDFKFTKLINSGSSTTIRNQKLTLEFTSNPAWYAVQALPYLMEYPYECTEQTFSRFYANSLASHIANSDPKIKRVFDSWKNTPDSKALLSNLEKNEELKSLLLQETPWVLDGKDETERKKRVGLLFDLNRMSNELNTAMTKLQKEQTSNGGWPWFPGMPESRYITQHIVSGMGHLDKLNVESVRKDEKTWTMLKNAVGYLDNCIKDEYDYLKKYSTPKEMELNNLSYEAIQYLYGRSYFTDLPIPKRSQEAFDYFKGQEQKYWLSQSKYMEGMIALALFRWDDKKTPKEITKSLKETSITNEELGMYWKENELGYYWYQAPIETEALMVEVFDEVANDQSSVNDLKVWLLKQKQTQDWKTTRATVEAVYALLRRGADWLASDEQVEIKMAGKVIDPKKIEGTDIEAGTGYFKTSWNGSEIKPEMGNITLTKTTEGVSWGALYWQYFEDMDKITPHETPLKLKKQLFIEQLTDRGKVIVPLVNKGSAKIGDKIIVRIELRVDRDMEYVHMKDMRASGFEPINVISTYKYQDGLGYYESTKDAATNFFMGYLPKGTYVFEYPLRVTHEGDFANGITTIQCMYAPEFTSHSEGIRVSVTK
jgi:uncharacterized protein YfaS (alpha-2-macroglobulin family)